MRHHSSKIALLALAGAAVLATGSLGEAVGQTPQKPAVQKMQVTPGGGGRPTGPGAIKANPPARLPDFILEPGLPGNVALGLPNTGFCKRVAPYGVADRIAYKVRFATNGTTAPTNGWGISKVTISFHNGPSTDVQLPSPSWNGTVAQEVNIPNSCYGVGGCQFTITVDPDNVVPESSNANNSFTGICATPAG